MAKRTFDIVFALIGIVLTAPVMAVLAVAIKLTSPGPVLYRGVRVGRGNVPFRIWKFRSMVVDAERIGAASTAGHDSRITPVGRFMRQYKLDELPQLFNVLSGTMSFVGPRPEVQKFVDLYTEEEQVILQLRPGITDWASIWNSDEGAVLDGAPDADQAYAELIRPTKIELQKLYARRHSLWVDLKIIAYTFVRLVRKEWLPAEIRPFGRPVRWKEKHAARSPHVPSRVAVIIPTRNERRFIARCLDSVLASDYDTSLLDIVVVDGMSDDGTREIVEQYAERYGCIRLVDNPRRIKPVALNLGIANTTAEVVMRIDAHAVYDRRYLPILVAGLDRHGADNIGGIRMTDPGTTAWTKAIAYAISHPFAVGNAFYRTGVRDDQPRTVDTVFCGCYRREVFHKIGGFNEKLIRAQDRELNERLRAQGGKIVLDPSARCTYFPRTSLVRYGRWSMEGAFWLYYASRFTTTRMTTWRNWLPVCFVLWHAVTLGVALLSPGVALVMALGVGLYWLLNGIVSVRRASAERQPILAPYLMLLFAITHYGYGIGAIAGWLTARWKGQDLGKTPELVTPSASRAA